MNQERIRALTAELTAASDSYYNTGVERMSNLEYDRKFDELKRLETEAGITDGFTSKVGSAATSKLQKVTHEYEAKSLGKTKDIEELISVQNNPAHASVCLSWKCDGSTVQLTYQNGTLLSAVTRGDGKVGQDITENSRFIEGIPRTLPYRGKLVVRGEALMSYAEFQRLNGNGEYANPRNLANATITALDQTLLSDRNISFQAFELVAFQEEESSDHAPYRLGEFGQRLDYLQQLGFGVVEHQVLPVSELRKAISDWSNEARIASLGFPVDGLVIANNDVAFANTLQGTEHHPNLMKGMAFKWKDETVTTTLRAIEWQVGRTGVLTPVAVFDSVSLQGTTVTKASLHNVSYIREKDLRIGDTITIYKANMIIPQVAENLSAKKPRFCFGNPHGIPTACPCCKATVNLHTSESGVVTALCPNEQCLEKQIGKLAHFVSKHGMNIEGLSENTLRVLMEQGMVQVPSDLYRLETYREPLSRLDGFGEKSVSNLLRAIEASRTTDVRHFLYAQGIDGFGRGQIKLVIDYLETNYEALHAEYDLDQVAGYYTDDESKMLDSSYDLLRTLKNMEWLGFDFTQIDGIGTVLSESLTHWIRTQLNAPSELPRLTEQVSEPMRLLSELTLTDHPAAKEHSSVFAGKKFCITGSLETFPNRDAMVVWIQEHGGQFVSGVSSKTDYLINNDVTSTSGKNKKAKELGIPILSEKTLLAAAESPDLLPAKGTRKPVERET